MPDETDAAYAAKDKRMWLSCISAHSPEITKSDGRTVKGCNNKYPERGEMFGWSLEDIDNEDAKMEFQINGQGDALDMTEETGANAGLTAFFNDMCTRQPCEDNLAFSGDCESLNANDDLKNTCNQSVVNASGGGYRQCILNDEDQPRCVESPNKCNMIQ